MDERDDLGRSAREHYLAAVLIGLGVLFRFNHLPAYAVLLAIFALRPGDFQSSRTTAAAVVATAVMVVCAPMLAHNLYYGHQWRVIPDSAQVNYDIPRFYNTSQRLLVSTGANAILDHHSVSGKAIEIHGSYREWIALS